MEELYRRLNARSPLQHLAFEPGMNWWWISPSNNLREQVKYSVHLLEQVGYMETEESFGKVKLRVLLERKFGDKFILQQEAVCDSDWTCAQRASKMSAAGDACERPRRGQGQEMDGFEEKCSSRGRDYCHARERN
jgi:hypothetical protein